jgi:hypothetical protein
LSLEDATWDEFGRRVLTGTEAFDGKESSKERKLRRQARPGANHFVRPDSCLRALENSIER